MRSNIVIFGSSRSGKTALSMLINKTYNYNALSADTIVSAFERSMPELNINRKNGDRATVLRLKPFLDAFISSLNDHNNRRRDYNYVVEGSYLDIESYKDYVKYTRIVLVQDLPTYQDFYDNLIKYDKSYDWTSQISHEKLVEYCKNLKRDNDRIIKYCKENNIKYYNTAENRKEVFTQIISDLKERIYKDKDDFFDKIRTEYGSISVNVEAPAKFLGSLARRFTGVIKTSGRFKTPCDYSIRFLHTLKDKDFEPIVCHLVGVEIDVTMKVDNKNRECYVLLDKKLPERLQKQVIHKMVKLVYLRLFQLKKAVFLHCACVEKNGKVVIVSGNPMSGKSVTLLHLLDNGFNYITNDFLIIDYFNGKPQFLPSSKYAGIRRTQKWLENPNMNKKYGNLVTKDKIVVNEDSIMIPPAKLVEMNNVDFGKLNSELSLLIFPKYMPEEKFSVAVKDIENLKQEINYQLLYNFMRYSNESLDTEDFAIYKIDVDMGEQINNDVIFNTIFSAQAYDVKQNENTVDEYLKFINEKINE